MATSNLSMRDRTIFASLFVVIMYVGLVLFWLFAQSDAWNKARRQYDKAKKDRIKEDKLIAERQDWEEQYEAERAKMPIFPEGQSVDTHWQRMLDGVAAENYITISKLQSGAEEAVGEKKEVFELPIDTRNWEGSISSLVAFLYTLENLEDAMFDVRTISIQPNSAHKGFLKGDFVLTCAYLRGEEAEEEDMEEEVEEETDEESDTEEVSGAEEVSDTDEESTKGVGEE